MRRASPVLVELIRVVVVATATGAGYQIARAVFEPEESTRLLLLIVLGSLVGYVAGGMLGRVVENLVGVAEERMAATAGADLVAGGFGAIAGAVIGSLLGWPLLLLPSRALAAPALAFVIVVLGALGYRMAQGKREDILQLLGLTHRTRAADLRVLDTSALLNVRLLDYVRAGLIRGTLLVPTFVLEEAQGIADSADTVRRRRAHRGLEALAAIRREELAEVRTVERHFPEFDAVDAKVVALARERGAALVTDDSALARVAELQGIEVVFLRRVADALRPQVLPGEAIRLELLREGREPGQGVGYLEDGTMVVVEDAAARVGSTVDAVVARVVQTAGGRMLFARIPDAQARETGA